MGRLARRRNMINTRRAAALLTGVLLLLGSILFADESVFDSMLSTHLKYPKKLYDYQEDKNSAPALLVKGADILKKDSTATMLTKDLFEAWFSYYKEINLYYQDKIKDKREELDNILQTDKLYFSVELKADLAKTGFKNIKIDDMYVFLLNDQGKIVDTKQIVKSDNFILIENQINKFIVSFPRKIPGTRENIMDEKTSYLKLYVNVKDSLYMFKFDLL
jgi:hypothetical protein